MSVKIPADVRAAMTEIARQFGRHDRSEEHDR